MATTTFDLELFFLKRAIDDASFKYIDEKESQKTKQMLYDIITKWKVKLEEQEYLIIQFQEDNEYGFEPYNDEYLRCTMCHELELRSTNIDCKCKRKRVLIV